MTLKINSQINKPKKKDKLRYNEYYDIQKMVDELYAKSTRGENFYKLYEMIANEDRIIQQAIRQILEPICEAKFYDYSFGFRPNRSAKHAIARCYHLMQRADLHFVVDIDIKGFFDNVNHSKLLKQMYSLGIRDKRVLSITSKMLKCEIEGVGIQNKGTPQGGILSPLLSNIALNELDWWIHSQFYGMKTRHEYSCQLSHCRALKGTKLKEIHNYEILTK